MTAPIARVSAGVPNGGQFAPRASAESAVVFDGSPTARPALPAWDELQGALDDAVTGWATGLDEETATVGVDELLRLDDEDAMIEAYGEERSDFLCSLEFRVDRPGRLEVFSGRQLLARERFSFEDGPDISRLMGNAPAGQRWTPADRPAHMQGMSFARLPAGIRTGGQVAPTAHAPTELELPAPKALPAWSEDELEADLADALAEWTEQLQNNTEAETSATELLHMTDPAAIADAPARTGPSSCAGCASPRTPRPTRPTPATSSSRRSSPAAAWSTSACERILLRFGHRGFGSRFARFSFAPILILVLSRGACSRVEFRCAANAQRIFATNEELLPFHSVSL